MSENVTHVLVAGYLTREPALVDYQTIVDSGVEIDGAVCVTRDLEGNLFVEVTNRLDMGGAAGGGPPQLDPAQMRGALVKQAKEVIPWGGAGLLSAYPHTSAEGIDKLVTRALMKFVGEAEGSGVAAIRGALMDAHQKAVARLEPAG